MTQILSSACCEGKFKDYVISCPETITLATLNLDAATQYEVVFHNSVFGTFSVVGITDDDGLLVIDINDLPDGFFNAHTGSFTLKVYPYAGVDEEALNCAPIAIQMSAMYDSIELELLIGDRVKSIVGCKKICVEENPPEA